MFGPPRMDLLFRLIRDSPGSIEYLRSRAA
jgi:hypothetical protein